MKTELTIEAEKILDIHCDSLPAWTENRKRAVLNAMLDFGIKFKDLRAQIPCECRYPLKEKNYDRCVSCGGNYKQRKNK